MAAKIRRYIDNVDKKIFISISRYGFQDHIGISVLTIYWSISIKIDDLPEVSIAFLVINRVGVQSNGYPSGSRPCDRVTFFFYFPVSVTSRQYIYLSLQEISQQYLPIFGV